MLDELCLVYPTTLGVAFATVYTTPADTRTVVREVVIANRSVLSAKAFVSLVPSGGAAGVSNLVVPGIEVAPNKLTVVEFHLPMQVGDFLSAYSDSANAINLTVTGVERGL